MPASWCSRKGPAMLRCTALLLLFILAGCDRTDPYLREGVWRPSGANDANLRAMVVVPSDLAAAAASPADGGLAAAALSRLRRAQVQRLPDSGVAQIVPVGSGSAASPATAPPSGTGN
jgi:hypothetical protein